MRFRVARRVYKLRMHFSVRHTAKDKFMFYRLIQPKQYNIWTLTIVTSPMSFDYTEPLSVGFTPGASETNK